MARYPQPGTMADRILAFIVENPGASTNKVIEKLAINPSPARKCIVQLLKHELIVDEPNGEGHHAYRVKTSL